jgi:hypothetical protein
VTGSRGLWRAYDWSDVGRRLGQHIHLHAAAQRDDRLDAVVLREGKNFKGRMLGILLGSVGKRNLRTAFEQTIKAIEARNNEARAADPR